MHGVSEHIAEFLETEEFIVPRELVGAGYGGAGKVVVELVPYEAAPGSGEVGSGVGFAAQKFGRDGGALGRISQQFVLAVVKFHGGLRRIDAATVKVHKQFTVKYRKLAFPSHPVFVGLVGGGADDLDGPVAVDAFLQAPYRFDCGGTSRVTGTIIMIDHMERIVREFDEFLVIGQVLLLIAGGVTIGVGKEDLGAINALPHPELERISASVRVEGLSPPGEFLGREANQAAVLGNGRQGVWEAEAVREENVRTLDPELLAVISLSQ